MALGVVGECSTLSYTPSLVTHSLSRQEGSRAISLLDPEPYEYCADGWTEPALQLKGLLHAPPETQVLASAHSGQPCRCGSRTFRRLSVGGSSLKTSTIVSLLLVRASF